MKNKIFKKITLISLVISFFITNYRYFFPYMVSFEIQSSNQDYIEIYYAPNNQSFIPENSFVLKINKTNEFQTINHPFSQRNIKALRIDSPAGFELKSINIKNRFKKYNFLGNSLYQKIRAINPDTIIRLDNNIVWVETTKQSSIEIVNIPTINPSFNFIHVLVWLVITIIIYIVLTILYFLNNYLISKKINLQNRMLSKKETDILIPTKTFNILLFSIFSWFLFQTCFFATNIKNGISPDEIYHFNVSKLYQNFSTLFIKDSESTYQYGAVSTSPYFYHLLMGKLLLLNVFHIPEQIYLRLINIFISTISLYVTYLLCKEFTKNNFIQLFTLLIQTNILMFVFLSSMISYDNLVNLISATSFLFLFKSLKTYSRIDILKFIILLLVGLSTKNTFIPVALMLIMILLTALVRKRNKTTIHNLFQTKFESKEYYLIFIVIIFTLLNFKLYGNNIIKYKTLSPSLANIIGQEESIKYHNLSKRNSDMLSTASNRTVMPNKLFINKYINKTISTIFGIMAHKNLLKTDKEILCYKRLICISLFIFLLNIKKTKKEIFIIFFISLAYMILIMYVNYSTYQSFRVFGLALQGRYNFPVLSTSIIFLSYNFLIKFTDKIKILLIMIVSTFLIYNSFFWFIFNASVDWYK